MRFFKYTFLFITILPLFSCHYILDISNSETLLVKLPEWPPANTITITYPEISRWKVSIESSSQSVSFFTDSSEFYYEFLKNKPVCITAQPITLLLDKSESMYFNPSGYIYPYASISNAQIQLTWEDGFLADIMHRIICSKKETGISTARLENFLMSFNWEKAQATINKKITDSMEISDKSFFNPWNIDSSTLLDNLCFGNFKSTLFNISGGYNFSLSSLCTESTFIPVSSFIPENRTLHEKNLIYLKKNKPFYIGDGFQTGIIFTCKSAKNVSKEYLHMPILIEDI